MPTKIWRLSRSLEDACNASYSLKFKGEELKCNYVAFGEQNKMEET